MTLLVATALNSYLMGTLGQYFLNGPNLATSTAVFTDAALTTCAPDGFYSQSGSVRQLQNCTLLPRQQCSNCANDCRVSSTGSSTTGLYLILADLGVGTGAVRVKFTPGATPDGIRAIYNDTVYNSFSSDSDGLHEISLPTGLIFLGNSANDCGLTGTTYILAESELYNNVYTTNGNITNVAVTANNLSLSPNRTAGDCYMYFPKTLTYPATCLVEIAQCCTGQTAPSWSVEISCPDPLPSINSTRVFPLDGCNTTEPYVDTVYLGKVSGATGTPVLHDWLFNDSFASSVRADGDYKVQDTAGTNAYLVTVTSGVLTAVNLCP